MGSTIRCFLLESTDKVRHGLRRWAPGDGGHFHTAGPVKLTDWTPQNPNDRVFGDFWPHDDPRWPKTCACGYVFQDTDHWQRTAEPLWADPRTGRLVETAEAEPGACWLIDAELCVTSLEYRARGDSGPCLWVKLPDGTEWNVDGPAGRSHGFHGWDRTGIPPLVTVRPSILTPKYHGFLTDGCLVEC